jgi:hypothetical protein
VSWLYLLHPLKAAQPLTGVSRKQQSSASRQAPNAAEQRQMAAAGAAAAVAHENLEQPKPLKLLLLLLQHGMAAIVCRCARAIMSRSGLALATLPRTLAVCFTSVRGKMASSA